MADAAGAARLAAGHHLYPARDGTWRCYGPGDRFTRVGAAGPELAEARRVLHGTAGGPGAGRCGGLLQAFGRQGLLERGADGPEPVAVRAAVVHVEGDNPVGHLVAELLVGSGAVAGVTRGLVDRAAVARSDLVVTCAGWLPDARYRQVDRWCAERAVPWHMGYAEGLAYFVGPCATAGAASYADTRGRRLAAAGFPDEVLDYWRYLDRAEDLPPVPWPSRGGVAVIAGLLVADALAVLHGLAPPSRGAQLEIDTRDLSVRRHPVLPLPALSVDDRGDSR